MYLFLGWKLVGLYDIFVGKYKGISRNKNGRKFNYFLYYCYYYDFLEFMIVIRGDDKIQFYIGYFRDVFLEMLVFVVVN